MTGIETGLTGGLGLLILVVAGLAFLLYLVLIPLWTGIAGAGAGGCAGFSGSGRIRCPVRPIRGQGASTALAQRRFSRKALMGNGRDVQNAIVIAAILGPCRAYEPHDIR